MCLTDVILVSYKVSLYTSFYCLQFHNRWNDDLERI